MHKTKISQKLFDLRKDANYTQQFVADYLGIVRQTYSHYETDRLTPSLDVLCSLAELYHIAPEILLSLVIPSDVLKSDNTSESAQELDSYLNFSSTLSNRVKYQGCSVVEKKLLYYFSMLNSLDQNRLIHIARLLSDEKLTQKP